MTTTFETIRDRQATLIEALTPLLESGAKFKRHAVADEFMTWVEANPRSCFRRFQILSNFDDIQEPTADGAVEGCRHTMELRLAYPLSMGKYGRENGRDMEDVIRLDMNLVDKTIGRHGGSNYVSGQHAAIKQSQLVIELTAARVLSMNYLVLYDRSV